MSAYSSSAISCFANDNDDAGRKGAREFAQRLGVERCRVATFGDAKDANGYLECAADLLTAKGLSA